MSSPTIKPCECGHAKAHHPPRMVKRKRGAWHGPCGFPACRCRLYIPARIEPPR